MTPIKRLRVNWPNGLKLRERPEPTNASFTGIVVPHRTIVEALGDPQPYDERFTFQRVRTPGGQEGWLTYRGGDTLYLTPVESGMPPGEGERLRVDYPQGLRMRTQPEPSLASFTGDVIPHDTVVLALGVPFSHREGYVFQRVRTPDGKVGWLTRSFKDTVYLNPAEEEEPEPENETGPLWVVWYDGLKLRERPEPSMASFTGIIVPYGAQVTGLGDPQSYDTHYAFQRVRLVNGEVGYLTHSFGTTTYLSEEEPDVTTQPVPLAQVNPAAGLWAEMRSAPAGPITWWVGGAVPLQVVNPAAAGAKIGHAGQWIEVQTPAFKRGFIGAQYLKPFTRRPPDTTVPPGESPYIYGIHDPYDRSLLTDAGVTGWVLITYGIGTDFEHIGGDRNRLYSWASEGFGVIARLNHGYGSSGTVPDPAEYPAFARTCAEFVRDSIDPHNPRGGCHIWIIGNEMNNPREWPGNHEGVGGRRITPEGYADCFNRTYRAIKQVYREIDGVNPADAVVVPGAVDPYNAEAGDNGEWFTRMLRRIVALDGFALHAYTHGVSPDLITNRKRFGQEQNLPIRFPDPQLSWQYYDFYAYRTFMDLIPGKWRDVPVFITETDQVQRDWHDANTGWVRRMYDEVARWNSDPSHQRIKCSLLFRWETDEWQIRHKPNVQQDFKEAAQKKQKWLG